MKTCILHVGMPKSGSTAIQGALFENRAAFLKQHNVNYFDYAKNHSKLRHDLKLRVQAPEKGEVPVGILAALEERLPENTADNFVISGEALSRTQIDAVPVLKDIVVPYFDRLKVIIYVRAPQGFVSSMAQQHLKNGATFAMIDQDTFTSELAPETRLNPAAPMASVNPQYKFRIEKFLDVFGADNVTLRPFDRKALRNGDVVDDFLWHGLGIDQLGFDLDTSVQNTAMDNMACFCLEALNRAFPVYEGTGRNPKRARTAMNKLVNTPRHNKFELPSFDYKRFRALIKPEVNWLKTVSGGDIDFSGQPTAELSEAYSGDYTALAHAVNAACLESEARLNRVQMLTALSRLRELADGPVDIKPILQDCVDGRQLRVFANELHAAGRSQMALMAIERGLVLTRNGRNPKIHKSLTVLRQDFQAV